jgi:SAM-dependent methyltransferase
MRLLVGTSSVSRLLAGPRDVAGAALMRLFKAWAGVPSGPLGWAGSRAMPVIHRPLYQVMGDALQLRPDDELLDVACGSGVFLARQAGHVHRVAAVDLSDVQIALAHRRLGDRIAAGTAEIVQGDAGALPWPDDSFTVVTCMGSFEAFPDPEKVLAEMFRVLRPGGRVVVNIGEEVTRGTQTHRMLGQIWVWAEDDVRHMVEDAGFTDVTIQYAPSSGNASLLKLLNKLSGPVGKDLRLVRALKE